MEGNSTMEKQITKFGSLEPLLIRDGKIVTELATFHSNGRSHKHDQWEVCYVLSGKGSIHIDQEEDFYIVEKGSVVEIPPNTGHWMELDHGDKMEILLVYSDNPSPIQEV